jgi:hypothetical protein
MKHSLCLSFTQAQASNISLRNELRQEMCFINATNRVGELLIKRIVVERKKGI